MSKARLAAILSLLALAGCARPPEARPVVAEPAQVDNALITGSIAPVAAVAQLTALPPKPAFVPHSNGRLAGRTIAATQRSDIALRHGEVILTFDDGPKPGTTEGVLRALDTYGVNATFLMVGRMADAHPDIARMVALSGNSIGTHTYDHANLSDLSSTAAMDDVRAGEAAVTRALLPVNQAPSPFFRFPYLAQTTYLRTSLSMDHAIVLDVEIDSKDYYDTTPQAVMERTLRLVQQRGSGIILFHDIHPRTVAMLPEFLQSLQDMGFSVVRLTAKGDSVFDRELVTASVE